MANIKFVATQVLEPGEDGVSLRDWPWHCFLQIDVALAAADGSTLLMRTLQLSFKTSQLESEEEHKARLAKERAAQGKTLFEQLAENKEKAQQDYDAVTKQIFGRGRVNILYHVWRD